MNIKPLSDHVLIEPLKEEQKTKTGILLPETAEQERSEQGTVIAVGPGKKGKDGKVTPLEVKAGDLVLFTKYGPNEVKVDGKDYLIAEAKDILAILEQ
ncbi:MAG: co-chaperone GroES [bacterium]|nr:co-chaperone GroES [bacterium]